MKSGWALVFAAASLLAFSSCSNSNNASTGSGIVWVATSGDQMINTYTINSTTGAGSRVGNGVPSGVQPSAMVMTPDRKSIFVADAGEIRAFSVSTNGTLAAIGSPVPVTPSPSGVAVDPTGQLLFVVSQGNAGGLGQPGTVPGAISIFNISNPSTPTPVTNSPFPSALPGDSIGNGPVAVAVSPVGGYVYVANQFTNTVGAFSYDATAGTLTFIAAYNTGANPAGLAFSRCAGGKVLNSNCTGPDGDTLFVANSGLSNDISIFTACIEVTPTCASPTGRLQAVSISPVAASGIGPSSIIVSPVLDFVYVVDTQSNQVSQFKYGPSNGSLTALAPAAISTGAGPVSGGITSDGAFVIVPDSGGSELAVFKANNGSSTGVAATGILTRATSPSITLSGQPTAVVVR